MDPKKPKDNNDLQLFKEAMHDVTPIQHNKVVHQKKFKPVISSDKTNIDRNVANESRFSTAHVPDCEVILNFERPGIQKATVKKLRQGKLATEASLDLHGYTAEQARSAMIEFMDFCSAEQFRVVIIVHGKGFGSSKKKPVIKPLINKWLQELNEVLAFTSAQPKDGGTGAVYVFLRKDK